MDSKKVMVLAGMGILSLVLVVAAVAIFWGPAGRGSGAFGDRGGMKLTIEVGEGSSAGQIMPVLRHRLQPMEEVGDFWFIVDEGADRRFGVALKGVTEEAVEQRLEKFITRPAKLRFRMVDDQEAREFFEQFYGEISSGKFEMKGWRREQPNITHPDKEVLEALFEGHVDDEHVIGYEWLPRYATYRREKIDPEKSRWRAYYVHRKTHMTGQHVKGARVEVDESFMRPVVTIDLDAKGDEIFGELTREHVDERLAVMLDDRVKTAPVINEPIPGGRVQITFGSLKSYEELMQEARDLVIFLRSGSYPAPLRVVDTEVIPPRSSRR